MGLDLKKFEALLVERRAELALANDLSGEARQAVTLDQQSVGRVSRIDAMQRQEMAKAGEQRRMLDINRIDAAMQRIKSGDYGDCLECGEEIAAERLEFDPAAIFCIDCAQRRA